MGINRNTFMAARLRKMVKYDPETGQFVRRKNDRDGPKGVVLGKQIKSGYVVVRLNGIEFFAHRLAWLFMTGAWPAAQIDHRDRDRGNNKFANLRAATQAQNCQNIGIVRSGKHSTGLIGASLDTPTGKYTSHITLHGKVFSLGRFDTKEEAHEMYLSAKKQIHPFSRPEYTANPKFVDYTKDGRPTRFFHKQKGISKERDWERAEKVVKRLRKIPSADEKTFRVFLDKTGLDRISAERWVEMAPRISQLLGIVVQQAQQEAIMKLVQKREKAPRQSISIADKIAAAQANLKDLLDKQKEQERRDVEQNREYVLTLVKRYGWDRVGNAKWDEIATKVDDLLKGETAETVVSAEQVEIEQSHEDMALAAA